MLEPQATESIHIARIKHIAHDYKLVRLCLMFSKQTLQGTLLFSATQDFAQAVAT